MSTDDSGGVKVCLEDQMDNVVKRLHRNIEEQLGGGNVRAISLATTVLAKSVSFIHELSNYITITLAELKRSGFSSQDNWYLISKLLFRMFAIDFHKVRSIIGEGLDIDKLDERRSRKILAKRVLWGILQTHAKMKEYLSIGCKNHPSISSEYARFLVQNASVGRVARLEQENKESKEKVEKLSTLAQAAMKKGETALNRADEAKKLIKSREGRT